MSTAGRYTVSAGVDQDGPFVAVTDNLAIQAIRYDVDTAMEVSQMMAKAAWQVLGALLHSATDEPAIVVGPDLRPIRNGSKQAV